MAKYKSLNPVVFLDGKQVAFTRVSISTVDNTLGIKAVREIKLELQSGEIIYDDGSRIKVVSDV